MRAWAFFRLSQSPRDTPNLPLPANCLRLAPAQVMRACSAEPRLVANVQALEDILTPADLRDLKHKIYGVFRGRPDLLPAEEEAMSKEEHRELVRQCLSAVISSGEPPYLRIAYRLDVDGR